MATTIKTRRIPWYLLFFFFFLVVGAGVVGYLYYANQGRLLRNEKEIELLAIADLKVGQIDRWRQERLNDATIIFNTFLITSRIQQFLEGSSKAAPSEDLLSWMSAFQIYGGYESILLIDRKEAVRASVPPWRKLGGPFILSFIKEATETKKIVFSDLYRDEARDRIYLDIVVPIFISRGNDSSLPGFLLLRSDPHQFLYPLIQSWPTPSRTAETLVVRREGAEAVFLNELRHQRNTALFLRISEKERDRVPSMAIRGVEGIVEGRDYRGVKVLAAIRKVPESPWYLIAKVDLKEIDAPIHAQGWTLAIVVGLLVLGAAGMVGFFWQKETTGFFKRQYEDEIERQALTRHYEYLTKYANDIIILYDQELRLVEANERAVETYGYMREELLQLDALRLRPPETRPSLEATKKEVEEKKSLFFETIHQRKDGTTFPVEISTRLIEVGGKTFHQSIIRDITERKQAEKEREKLIYELREALAKVKQLGGLLPICASCKKIRDDKGYWNQIETYIGDHSEAEFSHGICPECMRKLYPDFADEEKG